MEPSSLPPSLDNNHLLALLNLFIFSSGAGIFLMIALDTGWAMIRDRFIDRKREPAWIWRLIITLWAIGFAGRCGVEAAVLFGWQPEYANGLSPEAVLKRVLDPIFFTFGCTALIAAYLSQPGMIVQLRTRPFPIRFWTALPMLVRPAGIAITCLVMSAGMVWLRPN